MIRVCIATERYTLLGWGGWGWDACSFGFSLNLSTIDHVSGSRRSGEWGPVLSRGAGWGPVGRGGVDPGWVGWVREKVLLYSNKTRDACA